MDLIFDIVGLVPVSSVSHSSTQDQFKNAHLKIAWKCYLVVPFSFRGMGIFIPIKAREGQNQIFRLQQVVKKIEMQH